jgi:hypothetical protein
MSPNVKLSILLEGVKFSFSDGRLDIILHKVAHPLTEEDRDGLKRGVLGETPRYHSSTSPLSVWKKDNATFIYLSLTPSGTILKFEERESNLLGCFLNTLPKYVAPQPKEKTYIVDVHTTGYCTSFEGLTENNKDELVNQLLYSDIRVVKLGGRYIKTRTVVAVEVSPENEEDV